MPNRWVLEIDLLGDGVYVPMAIGASSLQEAYSGGEQIITSSAGGAVTFQGGEGIDTATVFEIKNNASALTASITADGFGDFTALEILGSPLDTQYIYDNTTGGDPHIITDAAFPPFIIQSGTGDDSDPVLEVKDNAGEVKFQINGLGEGIFSSTQAGIGGVQIDPNGIQQNMLNMGLSIKANGTGSIAFGQPAGFWAINSTGKMSPVGAAQYQVPLNTAAFVVLGLAATGLFFRSTPIVGYAFTGLAGTDIFRGYVDLFGNRANEWYSRDGFSTSVTAAPILNANVNNWNLETAATGSGVVNISASVAVNVTGILAPAKGNSKERIIYNTSAFAITFKNTDVLSLAANRFQNTTNADIILAQHEGIAQRYDTINNIWRVNKL